MRKKWGIDVDMKKMQQLAVMEILCLPLYLYAYEALEAAFWILLILIDSYELKQLDFKLIMNTAMKPQDQQPKALLILSLGYILALGVVAFKNFALAGILIANELLLMLAALANVKNKDKK